MKRTIKITIMWNVTNYTTPTDELVSVLKRQIEDSFGGVEDFKGTKVEVVYEDD